MKVNFYDRVEDNKLKFAVIIAKTEGKWIFCKHRERSTYELPGGHREEGETILEAAKRELYEETGALEFTIKPVSVYAVRGKAKENDSSEEETFGMLFYAEIQTFENELHSEIEEIIITEKLPSEWTYPLIQPVLLEYFEKKFVK